MMVDVPWKKVIEFSGAILKLTPLAPVGVAVGLGAGLFPDDKDDVYVWKVRMITEWKKLCRALMEIPMASERKGIVLRGKMWADWFSAFGEAPKQSWIEKLSAEV
jgi:hypothetical protein